MIYWLVVSFVLGIIFEQVFNFGWNFALLSVTVFFFIFLILRSEKGRLWFLCSIFFAIGILRMSFVDTSFDKNLLKLVGEKIYFEATITEEPDVRDSSVRYIVEPDFSSEYISGCTNVSALKNSSCSAQSISQDVQKFVPEKKSRVADC